jgi:hypothetical protein
VAVPNDPANLVSTARVKIACANNIFFDISNTNFTIILSTAPWVDLNGSGNGINYAATFAEDGGPVAIVDAAGLVVDDIDSLTDRAVVTPTCWMAAPNRFPAIRRYFSCDISITMPLAS